MLRTGNAFSLGVSSLSSKTTEPSPVIARMGVKVRVQGFRRLRRSTRIPVIGRPSAFRWKMLEGLCPSLKNVKGEILLRRSLSVQGGADRLPQVLEGEGFG